MPERGERQPKGQIGGENWDRYSRAMADERMQSVLSEREKEVGRLLVLGVSNKEIARALGIEVVTVKRHVGNICRKLGARNRTQAAMTLADETARQS
jgi:two-component system, NarL family, nitrate/nitrite response regulator NarL